MLTVGDAAAAIGFYSRALDATERSRVETPSGQIVAEMSIDGGTFFVVDENPNAFNLSPETLGGTGVRMSLIVDDADSSTAQAIAAGRPSSSRSPTSLTGSGRVAWRIHTATTG